MSDSESPPTGWSEADDDPHVGDKYDPRRPVTYESGDVQVSVHPAPGNDPEDDSARWQVDATDRSVTDPDPNEGIDSLTAEGREAALSLAREFMAAYNREKDVEEAIRRVEEGGDAE
ncbi:hypothetical protein [Halomarina litorea]|uniref:hypothetical protein n=1 Tax=Halomarina litorea TaxID=2961595 RepID=UPI0020C5AF00|nr:hypothetical protein [Halomarina sp. BCD28]